MSWAMLCFEAIQGLTPPPLWLQSETGGCTLTFGPRGSSVVTVPRERLQAGVEYTFNLTVWKAGRKEEVTNQTVGAAGLVLSPARQSPGPQGGHSCQGGLSIQGRLPPGSTERSLRVSCVVVLLETVGFL